MLMKSPRAADTIHFNPSPCFSFGMILPSCSPFPSRLLSPSSSALYFFFNLSLTLYNKIALVSFPYPWALTCIHSAAGSIGSCVAYRRGYFRRTQGLALRENLVLVAYSSLYTVNIAVSNVSLNLVSVPLHQIVRSTTPLFTILLSLLLFNKTYLTETYLSLIPVMLGVCLAT